MRIATFFIPTNLSLARPNISLKLANILSITQVSRNPYPLAPQIC